jgi:hypothetical protein
VVDIAHTLSRNHEFALRAAASRQRSNGVSHETRISYSLRGEPMPTNYGRLLADGTGAWLQYEHACGHIELLSERYLAHPICNILTGQTGNRARAEFEHPILAPLTSAPGRRPAIDFVVCDPYPTVSIAVESKWVDHSNASAFFLLAGQRRDLEAFFSQSAFYDVATDANRKPLLRHDTGGNHTISIGPVNRVRTPFLEMYFTRYSTLEFPRKIRTSRTAPFPSLQNTGGFQVYVWRIIPIEGRSTILGCEMIKHFARPKATKAEVQAILAAQG